MSLLSVVLSAALIAIITRVLTQGRFCVTLKDDSTVLVTRHYRVLKLGPFSCIVWEQVHQRRLYADA